MTNGNFEVSNEDYHTIDGLILEIKRQLRIKKGSPIDPKLVLYRLRKMLQDDKQLMYTWSKHCNPGDEPHVFTIPATTGEESLSNTLTELGFDKCENLKTPMIVPKDITDTIVYKPLVTLSSFDVIDYITNDWSKICLTQSQIAVWLELETDYIKILTGYLTWTSDINFIFILEIDHVYMELILIYKKSMGHVYREHKLRPVKEKKKLYGESIFHILPAKCK